MSENNNTENNNPSASQSGSPSGEPERVQIFIDIDDEESTCSPRTKQTLLKIAGVVGTLGGLTLFIILTCGTIKL
jgi:hypothetical protein